MITRKDDFGIVDLGATLELVPRQFRLITGMNLFETHLGTSTIAQIERVDEIVADIPARRRGGERNYVGSERAQIKNLNIPFFPLDKGITAADVQNFRRYFTPDAPKTVEDVVTRVVRRIRVSHEALREKALFAAVMGKSYAPGDVTCQYDYFQLWGVEQKAIEIDPADATQDPMEVIEEGRLHIAMQAGDNAGAYRIICLCSPEFFTALVHHPLVELAYTYYGSQQEPLRRRLGAGGQDSVYRVFEHKGMTFIEDISGNIPAKEARLVPMGIDSMFQLHFAPADDLAEANTPAQELYMWYKHSAYLREEKVESETSMLAVNTRPELVVKVTLKDA